MRWGQFNILYCDSAKENVNNIMKNLAQLLCFHNLRISPRNARSNSKVERVNREIVQKLRILCNNNQKTWPVHLMSVQCGINSAVYQATGFSPFKMVTSRDFRLSFDASVLPRFENDPDLRETFQYQKKRLQLLEQLAFDNRLEINATNKRKH